MTLYATVKRPAAPTPDAEVVDLSEWCERRYRRRVDEAQDLLADGDEGSALDLCFEAMRYASEPEEAALLGADAAALVGDPAAALDFARQAIAAAPDEPEGYHQLGSLLLDLGRMDEALTAAEHAVDLALERGGEISELAHLLKVEALFGLGRVLDARATVADARRTGAAELGLLDAIAARLEVG